MYKDMSEEQEKELGIWLAKVAQTEVHGGKINDETKKIVKNIIDSYDSMPKKTKESMKNAMSPMLTEMEKKQPALFAKATGIADGILLRLKKSFDIHSPSRKTRKIMKFVMQPMEEEMINGKKKLVNEAEKLADEVTDKLGNIDENVDLKTNRYINSENIKVQEIDYNKMASAMLKALTGCKLTFDEDGIAKIVKDEIYKVV